MYLKTCLLVTDDPDDHQAFSEAIAEISSSTIVLITLDSHRAIELMKSKRHIPDYIFIDLSSHGIDGNNFFSQLDNDISLSTIPTVVYGEEHEVEKIKNVGTSFIFNKEYDYSELRTFLKKIIKT
jgi:CheY-like chemotaxis protein